MEPPHLGNYPLVSMRLRLRRPCHLAELQFGEVFCFGLLHTVPHLLILAIDIFCVDLSLLYSNIDIVNGLVCHNQSKKLKGIHFEYVLFPDIQYICEHLVFGFGNLLKYDLLFRIDSTVVVFVSDNRGLNDHLLGNSNS
jgi:hypothetical protein